MMSDITFKLTAATNVGLVRSNNEDNFIVNPDLSSDQWFIPKKGNDAITLGDYGCLIVVADGMGGMNAGEVASEIAVETVKNYFSTKALKKATASEKNIESFLKNAVVTADANIKKKVKEDSSTSGMGTTIVMAWVLGTKAYVAWCGDSRAYLYNEQAGLSRLSKDHSYVQQLVDEGKLDPELAFDHPQSNIIIRSLGDSSVTANPEVVSKKLSEGDYLVLCTDGLCGLVRDQEITDVISGSDQEDIEDVKSRLISAALDAGGYDNVTVAVLKCLSVKEDNIGSTVVNRGAKAGRKKVEKEPEGESKEEEVGACEAPDSFDDDTPYVSKKKKAQRTVVALIIIIALGLLVYFSRTEIVGFFKELFVKVFGHAV